MPGLSREAHLLAGVFACTVVYWVTEALPLPVTALLASLLAVLLGVAPTRAVLAAYADPVVFLFLGTFVLAEAMQTSGLDRRLALAVLRWEWATRTPARVLLTIGAVTCALSLWLSNTATTAIMLPIGLGVLGEVEGGEAERRRFAVGFLLMLTWASSVAVGTPVGSPPNLIAIAMVRELGARRLSFFDWTLVAMPLTVVMLALCWLILRLRYLGGAPLAIAIRRQAGVAGSGAGPWTPAQRNVAAVFGLAVVLWVLPGALATILGPEALAVRVLEARLPESAVALLATVLLFALPVDWRRGHFTLGWDQAVRIDWGTLVLFGGGLALGRLLFDTGLSEAVGHLVVGLAGAADVWSLTALTIAMGVVLSEAASNTAAASAVVPLAIAVARAADVSPTPPALGAALGASFGFMLPVSTPPNAIVYGSRQVPLREMIVAGFWLDLAGAVLVWAGLRLLCPLLGIQ
jgi:sodium-dependent dicarboxylate transporter 2/3/5